MPFCINSDFRKLARDFAEVNADELIEKCVDLGVWCNQVCSTGGRWSLERLTNYIVSNFLYFANIYKIILYMFYILGWKGNGQEQKGAHEQMACHTAGRESANVRRHWCLCKFAKGICQKYLKIMPGLWNMQKST